MSGTDAAKAALAFLDRFHWRHGRGATLTAIGDGGRLTTLSFAPDEQEAAGRWIASWDGRAGIYFAINSVRGRLRKPKASERDIAFLNALHVDMDPRPGEDLEKERERLLSALRAHVPLPTIIIDSGRGFWGIWVLAEPVPVDGNVAGFKAYNVALERALDGDRCHNLDRIARLPGPINLKTGRRAEIVEADWGRLYSLNDFQPAPIERLAGGRGHATTIVLPDELPEVDLARLPIRDRWKRILIHGHDPAEPHRYGSRSEWVIATTGVMVRAGVRSDVIASALLDPDLGISKHVRAQSSPRHYAARQIARATEGPDHHGQGNQRRSKA